MRSRGRALQRVGTQARARGVLARVPLPPVVLALAFATVAPAAPAIAAQEPRAVREVHIRRADGDIRALCSSVARPRPPGPSVVLLHGEGASADAWRPVLERLAGRVAACAYDRPGSGGSGPAPERRGWYELLDELRRVHESLGAVAPYVLVGHSLGGLYARLYAADRPRDLAGLVLVEPAHEDLIERARTGMPEDTGRAWRDRRLVPNADGVVESRVAARAARSRLPAIPVTVLTATDRRAGEGWDPRFLNEAARQVHSSILRGVLQARHVPAEGSGPEIPRDAPDLVAQEILRMVEAVR